MSRQIGIIGLGMAGSMISRRLAQRGFSLSLYHPGDAADEDRIAWHLISQYAELSNALAFEEIALFVQSLPAPRSIFIMINAGQPTEEVLQSLLPHLENGDLIIDGGNAYFEDTTRRYREFKSKGIHFLGCGISGGIEATTIGLSLMAGGDRESYEMALEPLQALSARSVDGTPCCTYIGDEGAGHFVKTIHNGIEYAEMQLLAEVYSLLRWAVDLTPEHVAEVLSQWRNSDANGYLLEVTLNILKEKQGDKYVLDSILDSAGHKGTGVWAVQAAASFGVPAMMITASLHARYLSSQRHIRQHLNEVTASQPRKNTSVSTTDVLNAFQLARIINYHEGFAIIRAASKHFGWGIDLKDLSLIWTNGCIIRSALMNKFVILWASWQDELILHDDVKSLIKSSWPSLRRIVQMASSETLFTPCLIGASQYIAGASLRYPSANLVAAQRDYFGNHGFLTTDDPTGELHHYPWKRD